jgi:SAM-dependent methyltransferase
MAKIGKYEVPEDWPVKGEAGRSFAEKLKNGFFSTYMAGEVTIDAGYRAAFEDAVPILPHAIRVDLDYPGYDGKKLPFADESVDTVYSSHLLEHVADFRATIRDWHRVVRSGGFIVCVVPHQFLYEKRRSLPSSRNADHKRFYTPGSLLGEFEASLQPNTYRVRHLRDNDQNYTYVLGPEVHSGGGYDIELVVQKIAPPEWDLAGPPDPFQDDLERARDEVSRLTAERDAPSPRVHPVVRRRDPGESGADSPEFDSRSNTNVAESRSPVSRRSRLDGGGDRRSRPKERRGERAERFYLDALGSDAEVPEVWLRLGDSLKAAGKSPEAEFAYGKSVALRGPPGQS